VDLLCFSIVCIKSYNLIKADLEKVRSRPFHDFWRTKTFKNKTII